MPKTASLWGKPPSRYYRFLKRVESAIAKRPLRIAILGCSDGKFVLPAARRGHSVFAIDFDTIALNGGTKIGPDGQIRMLGLRKRLMLEGLVKRVTVVEGDFITYNPPKKFHAVLTSGSVQYSRNLRYSIQEIIEKLKHHVMNGGYIYIDYMLPLEKKHLGRENFPNRHEWQRFFPKESWRMINNRVLPPLFEAAHVDNPVDHYHHWGHLCAQRKYVNEPS